MSEPPAILTLPAAVLAFLWASEQERPARLAAARPPLRPDGDVPARVPGRRRRLRRPRRDPGRAWRAAGGRAWPAAGLLVARAAAPDRPLDDPQRRSSSTASCRSRPAAARRSTSAPTCPPTANTSGSRRSWSKRYLRPRPARPTPRRSTRSTRRRSSTASPSRYPDLPRDSALGKIGKENFSKYFGEDPLGYLAMTARKVGRMWSSGVGEAMSSGARPGRPDPARRARAGRPRPARRCGAAGGSWSRWRPRSSLVTAVGAASLAAPRRNEVLMTLVFPLAALALSAGRRGHILRPRMVPRAGIFPAELTALRSAGLSDRRSR